MTCQRSQHSWPNGIQTQITVWNTRDAQVGFNWMRCTPGLSSCPPFLELFFGSTVSKTFNQDRSRVGQKDPDGLCRWHSSGNHFSIQVPAAAWTDQNWFAPWCTRRNGPETLFGKIIHLAWNCRYTQPQDQVTALEKRWNAHLCRDTSCQWILQLHSCQKNCWLSWHLHELYQFEQLTFEKRVHCARITFHRLRRWLHSPHIALLYRLQLWRASVFSTLTYRLLAVNITLPILKRFQQIVFSMYRQLTRNHSLRTRESHHMILQRYHLERPLHMLMRHVQQLTSLTGQRTRDFAVWTGVPCTKISN